MQTCLCVGLGSENSLIFTCCNILFRYLFKLNHDDEAGEGSLKPSPAAIAKLQDSFKAGKHSFPDMMIRT